MNLDRLNQLDRIRFGTETFEKIHKWATENSSIGNDDIKLPFLEGLICIESNDISKEELIKLHNSSLIGKEHPADLVLTEEKMQILMKALKESETRVYFKFNEDNTINVAKLEYNTITKQYIVDVEFVYNFSKMNYKTSSVHMELKRTKEEIKEIVQSAVLIVADVTKYVSNYKEDLKIEENHIVKHKKVKGKKGSKSKSRVVRIGVKTYSFYTQSELDERREYDRHIESWTVRGHWRHYKKTGKTIWVKPYVKGCGDVEGKEYKL